MTLFSVKLSEIVTILIEDDGVVWKRTELCDALGVPGHVKSLLQVQLLMGAKSVYDYFTEIIGNWIARNGRNATVGNLQLILKTISCRFSSDKLVSLGFGPEVLIVANTSTPTPTGLAATPSKTQTSSSSMKEFEAMKTELLKITRDLKGLREQTPSPTPEEIKSQNPQAETDQISVSNDALPASQKPAKVIEQGPLRNQSSNLIERIYIDRDGFVAVKAGTLPDVTFRVWSVSGLTPFYDGSDSIYMFGGYPATNTKEAYIHRYDIPSSKIHTLDIRTPGSVEGVTFQADNAGNILLFGCGPNYSSIFKFNPLENTTSIIAQLPYSVKYSTTVNRGNGHEEILIIGGKGKRNGLLSYNMSSGMVTPLGDMSTSWSPNYYNQPTSVVVGDNAFIFGAQDPPSSSLVRLDLKTSEEQRITSTLPIFTTLLESAFDGKYIYLHGGIKVESGQVSKSRGLIQLDPVTYDWSFKQVEGYPLSSGNSYRSPPGMVFVEKLNKIYFFGGYALGPKPGGGYRKEIWYIDL